MSGDGRRAAVDAVVGTDKLLETERKKNLDKQEWRCKGVPIATIVEEDKQDAVAAVRSNRQNH